MKISFFLSLISKIPWITTVFFLCALVVGCTQTTPLVQLSYEAAGVPATGDTLVIGTVADASTLIPIIASDAASQQICGLIYNGLVKYDTQMNLIGDLAERWEIKEDGLVIIFYLRHGVSWHDGYAFTAEDVAFTYQKMVDPSVFTPYSGDFKKIESLRVIDSYTVEVRYKEPFVGALTSWGMGMLPKHVLEKENLHTTAFARNPIGTGPYRFASWRSMESIELVAFDQYFEGRPYIDRYIFRIIPDAAGRFLELLTGGIDQMELTPLQYARQTHTSRFFSSYHTFRYPSFGYSYMGFNLKNSLFEDRRVRQAMDYAINKKELIEGILLGLGEETTGPFIKKSWAYNPHVVSRAYDPQKARELLDRCGWKDTDHDGIVEKKGKKFVFTLLINSGSENGKMVAEIIQARLRDVGIAMKIRLVEWSAMLAEFIEKRTFEAVLMAWSLPLDGDLYDVWHSSKTQGRDFNFLGYQNAHVDVLLEQGRRTFVQAKRQQIYHKVHAMLYYDTPCIFLYVPDNLVAIHQRIKGVEVSSIGIGYNLIKWYVPYLQQKYTRKQKKE